ncbi:MAG: glycosyltransferase [Dehalococcoidales bacterium]|nr:glycosyltransferase [Dehalococcoidales bacterium]
MEDITSLLLFYLPLGLVGLWRWGTWMTRRAIGWFYRRDNHSYSATVSVVTPVYAEKPAVFRMALESWKANNPAEIIAVIDHTDKDCIQEFQSFSQEFAGARLIITEKPGKRPALADGIRAASGEIVALVDSDTIWSTSVLEEGLRPFADPAVGGVATRQNVLDPRSIAQNIFDIQLDLRFYDDMMPAAVMGDAFTVLSGRTAFYRRQAVLPMLDDLVNEKFWGKQCIGGDDKRLTYLTEAAGWKTRYQHTAQVYTPGAPDIATLFKQRTRWARNTWRADLRAMWQGWIWKHKFLSFILIDRIISNFTLLLSLSYFFVSLFFQLWLPAAILVAWWMVSRGVRISPNLLRRPSNIRLIPVYVATNFAMAIVRIYALLTLNRQDWMTRGARKRAGNFGLVLARVGTACILALLMLGVYFYRF